MSFFDEVDEPGTTTRAAPRRRRPAAGGRRPPTRGRRPPGDQQAIQVRRAIAAAAVVVVVILIVLGIHSCQISARNSAMKDYNNNVSSLIQESNQTGSTLFQQLSSGGGQSNATNLYNQINETRVNADNELTRARGINVPDEMKPAQQNVLLALQMRRDGIADIAQNIQPALGTSASKDAVNAIAADMARFYASDVVYKDYALPQIANAFHSVGIAVGDGNGETLEGGQFLPSVQWLTPAFIATELHVSLPSSGGGKPAPGLHGHSLNSVSVGGTTLQTGSTNTVPARPPPTFTLNFTNGGQNVETNVVCKVTVNGTSVSGQTIVPQTTPGQTTSCQVPLSTSPPTGTYTVTAEIAPVPGEKNTSNNSMSFPMQFQ